MMGPVTTIITLKSLPGITAKVDLNVLRDEALSTDLILGLNFFALNNISLTLNLNKKFAEERLQLFKEVSRRLKS